MDKLLSNRAKISKDWDDFVRRNIAVCNDEAFDEKENPSGCIDFGTVVNNLCDDMTRQKLNDIWECDVGALGYKEARGTLSLREAAAKFMTRFLETHEPVSPDNLFFVTGVKSCIDLLGHCLADPGDVFLVPTPMYARIAADLKLRSLVEVWPVPVMTEDDNDEKSELTLDKLIFAYESALAANHEVRGILLTNPHHPLGDMYPPELLMNVMAFCKANSLHVIVDEVYALAVFSETEKFHSILKFPDLPDPDRIHVLYGLSKDFGIEGLRVGVVHTRCKQLHKSLTQLSCFQMIPFPLMEVVAALLEDSEWCKEYIDTYQKRLAQNYKYCADYLKDIGVKTRESPAGFCLWVDLRHLCGSSFDGERKLFHYLLNSAHLYVGPGEESFCLQPGWFRIVFTRSDSHLKEGLRRFKKALADYDPSKE